MVRFSGVDPAWKRASVALAVALAFVLFSAVAGASEEREFLGASAGRRLAIKIMSREMSAAMTPWKIPRPVRKATDYSRHVWKACEKYGLDPFLVAALICVESEGRADAVNQSRVGLMQVNVQENMGWITRHFPQVKTVDHLKKPRNNVMAGTFALSVAMEGAGGVREALYDYLGVNDERRVDRIFAVVDRMNIAARAAGK